MLSLSSAREGLGALGVNLARDTSNVPHGLYIQLSMSGEGARYFDEARKSTLHYYWTLTPEIAGYFPLEQMHNYLCFYVFSLSSVKNDLFVPSLTRNGRGIFYGG